MSPYHPALDCLATVMSPEQRRIVFSVGVFADRTGKINHVSESGTGNFSTQGGEDMVMTSLSRTGVTVTDSSLHYRGLTEWAMGMIGRDPNSNVNVGLLLPDAIIIGSIPTFDFMPGSAAGARVAGAGASQSQNRVLVRMDGRVTRMIGGQQPSGMLLASESIVKQIVGFEREAGVTSFFGPDSSSTLVDIHIGERQNEPIQFMQGVMIDRLVFRLVANTLGITTCEPQLAWGDSLARLT
ncbi:MAG: CsgG/HfaB family protein [Patescibacteria group bacterium]